MQVRVNRTTPQNSPRLRPQRHQMSIRLTAQSRRSPDTLRSTNNLLRCLPNPSVGCLITSQVSLSDVFNSKHAHRTHSCPHSLTRRRPGEVAMHVGKAISSSTSEEAHDLRAQWERGAPCACLPEVPRPSQPRTDRRPPPAVRGAARPPSPTQADHRGAQQDPGPHHAEV